MPGVCPEFEWFEGALRGELVSQNQQRLWLEHVRQCRSCDAQWLAREELRKLLSGAAVPTLSSNFNRRLLLQLHDAPAPLSREARRWMQMYWLAATAATIYIVIRAEWLRPLLQHESFALVLLVLLAVGAFACFIQPRQIEQALAFLSLLLEADKPRKTSPQRR